MWFWWFLFFCNLLYPAAMIFWGWFMWKHPPKKINGIWGYRSSMSMKNQDTWRFAHHDCGKRWWKWGWILLIPTVLAQIPVYGAGEDAVGWVALGICVVDCTVMLLTIRPTEKALRKAFYPDGTRKPDCEL